MLLTALSRSPSSFNCKTGTRTRPGVDGEQPLIVEISRCPLACSLLVGAAHVSQGLVGNCTFTLEEPLADFTTANSLTLGGSGDDLRIVDVVLVDLLAQCVSPGYLEPFVLLVESDGALHLVATQAFEIQLPIRIHRLMCLCSHGNLPVLLSSVALVDLLPQILQLLHFVAEHPCLWGCLARVLSELANETRVRAVISDSSES